MSQISGSRQPRPRAHKHFTQGGGSGTRLSWKASDNLVPQDPEMELPLLPLATVYLPLTQKGLPSCEGHSHRPRAFPSKSEVCSGSSSCRSLCPRTLKSPSTAHSPPVCLRQPLHLLPSALPADGVAANTRGPRGLSRPAARDRHFLWAPGMCPCASFWGRAREQGQPVEMGTQTPGFLQEAASAGVLGTRGCLE